MTTIRIATRHSRLALWQARAAAAALGIHHTGLECELVPITTEGDRILDRALGEIGGKGLFIKELEQALYDGRADIAVHSMKDVTVDLPPGLALPVVMARGSPDDALVCPAGHRLDALPVGARVGSSSLRRQSQLRAHRSDLDVRPVRGNVDTRLAKLDRGEYDALVLACAGLERLELARRITERISPDLLLPAIGQGAMGIECRADDERVRALIAPLSDPETSATVGAERAMNAALAGGCHLPIAGFATIDSGRLRLRGRVATLDGTRVVEEHGEGAPGEAEAIGREVAERLLAAGADAVLEGLDVPR